MTWSTAVLEAVWHRAEHQVIPWWVWRKMTVYEQIRIGQLSQEQAAEKLRVRK